MLMPEQIPMMLAGGQDAVKNTTGFFADIWQRFLEFLPTLFIAVVVFFIGIVVAKLILKIAQKAVKRASVEKTASSFAHSLGKILFYALLIIVCLSIMGVPMSSIITVVGAAGVAIGLAVQNSLSNVAGGFIILFAKPFAVGDYIIAEDAEGFVQSVSILYTKIDDCGKSIYLPNGSVSAGKITNCSHNGNTKISVNLSISYESDFAAARKLLLAAIDKNPLYLQDPAPAVFMRGHEESAIGVGVSLWAKSESFYTARSELYILAKQVFDQAGIEIPYPQICVHTSKS